MEDYELEKSIYGWTMKIGNISYYDVPEDYALIIKQLEEKYNIEKSKNDKALEYIDRMTIVIDYNDDEFITWKHIEDIERLLRGEDNE